MFRFFPKPVRAVTPGLLALFIAIKIMIFLNFFLGKPEFMKTMKRRLENEAIPDGNKVRARNHVLLSDKSISDVVEALIGVHLANAGKVIIGKSRVGRFLWNGS